MTIRLLALLLAAAVPLAPAAASDRNYSVTGYDRIRVDGPYRVRVATGVAPFAKASGTAAAIDGISIEVQGRTLIVRKNPSAWGGSPGQAPGPVEINVGTHELSTVWLNGSGAMSIDKVKGLGFDVIVQGAGSVGIASVAVDQLKIGVTGTGSAALAGTAGQVSATVRGTASLDSQGLKAKDATIGADGGAMVRLTVTNAAKVEAQGTATVELSGRPSCTLKATGSAVVSGCR